MQIYKQIVLQQELSKFFNYSFDQGQKNIRASCPDQAGSEGPVEGCGWCNGPEKGVISQWDQYRDTIVGTWCHSLRVLAANIHYCIVYVAELCLQVKMCTLLTSVVEELWDVVLQLQM